MDEQDGWGGVGAVRWRGFGYGFQSCIPSAGVAEPSSEESGLGLQGGGD